MSSKEIADLLEKRHDDVKRSIKRLAERRIFSEPPLADLKYFNARGADFREGRCSMMDRRNFITAAAALPLAGGAAAVADSRGMNAVLSVIEELEASQGWEAFDIAAAKAYAAYKMRQALGLELPAGHRAQDHVDCQRRKWDDYQRTCLPEFDARNGRTYKFTESLSA
jgi:hypothetical protein